jgi:hypothetical protein
MPREIVFKAFKHVTNPDRSVTGRFKAVSLATSHDDPITDGASRVSAGSLAITKSVLSPP